MEFTYWHKQLAHTPLFPELLWSRPENKVTAGKLLIIGGNLHGFAVPAGAYTQSLSAGIGISKVLLPDATKKLIGPVLENGEFAPSTPSGSFSTQALADFLEHSTWADGVLLAGELGRNSETAILLEQFIRRYHGPLAITRDAVDYFKNLAPMVFNRSETLLVVSLGQLQKLCMSARTPKAITLGMDLVALIVTLHEISLKYHCHLMVKHHEHILVASKGQVSSTRLSSDIPVWRVHTATQASVWWLQNPSKPFEAFTTAVTFIA